MAVGTVDIEARGTDARALEMRATTAPICLHECGQSRALLELPSVEAKLCLPLPDPMQQQQPQQHVAPPTVHIRAGQLKVCLVPELLEGLQQLWRSPATVPCHFATATTATPSTSTEGILMTRLEQLHAAKGKAALGAPVLPTVDLSLEGAEFVLFGRRSTPSKQPQALQLVLGRVQACSSGSGGADEPAVASVEVASVEVALESSALECADRPGAAGPLPILGVACIGVEARYASASPSAPGPPLPHEPQQLGPQGMGDWLPSTPSSASLSVDVRLPPMQARLCLDRVLEALWILGSGPRAGVAGAVSR